MSKDTFTEKVSLWLDDELSPNEVAELKMHLASCTSCSQLYQAMQQVDALLRAAAMTIVAPEPGFSHRFETHLARQQELAQYRPSQPWQIWLAVSGLLMGAFLIFGAWAVIGGITLATTTTSLFDVGLLLQQLENFIDSAASARAFFNLGGLFLKVNVIVMRQPLFWVSILIAIAMSGLWFRILRNLSQHPFETVEFLM
jgi:hypothetical protein